MLMLTLLCVAFHLPILGVLAHAQKPVYSLFNSAPFQTYEAGLFAPLESLDLVPSDTFTVLSHPFFPKHSVRIKRLSGFCDTTAWRVPVTHVSSFQHSYFTSTLFYTVVTVGILTYKQSTFSSTSSKVEMIHTMMT